MKKRIDKELLQGAIDMHVHSAPALFDRHDALDIVRDAKEAGMRAMVLKHHHYPTVDRVHFLSREVPDIDLFSGVTLNYAIGGINPFAVHASLGLGVKAVWFPTIDTRAQAECYQSLGSYGGFMKYDLPKCYQDAKGIYVLDENDELLPNVKEVIHMIADADALLFLGHLTHKEVDAVVDYGLTRNVRIIIDHPNADPIRLPLEKQKELAAKGVILNYCFCEISPRWADVFCEEVADRINEVGAEHIVLSSDTGQIDNPLPSESLRLYYQILLECGVSVDDIYQMSHDNPAKLLYSQ